MIQGIKVAIEQTLEEIFGAYSTEYRRYSPAAVLNGGPVSLSMGRGHQDYRFRDYYDKSRQASIVTLQQAIVDRPDQRWYRSRVDVGIDIARKDRKFSW